MSKTAALGSKNPAPQAVTAPVESLIMSTVLCIISTDYAHLRGARFRMWNEVSSLSSMKPVLVNDIWMLVYILALATHFELRKQIIQAFYQTDIDTCQLVMFRYPGSSDTTEAIPATTQSKARTNPPGFFFTPLLYCRSCHDTIGHQAIHSRFYTALEFTVFLQTHMATKRD